jgi:hypothetical protein
MIGIRTSGAERHYPFQVEVSNANTIVCHVGRVYDSLSAGVYGSSTQNSWPANQNKITQQGLQKAQSYNKTELEYYPKAVKTGSAAIFYKGTQQAAFRGKATDANANNQVGQNGYIRWDRTGPEDEYIILHYVRSTDNPDTNKWCISAVEEGDISESDIVIAYIANGEIVRQIWRSDFCALGGGGGSGDHPWKVTCEDSASKVEVSISDGSINNVMLDNPTYVHDITSEGEYSVLLKVTCVGTVYPQDVIWSVEKDWWPVENTINECWLKAAHVKVVKAGEPETYKSTVTQLFSTSLRSERLKHGNALDAVRYYFNRI